MVFCIGLTTGWAESLASTIKTWRKDLLITPLRLYGDDGSDAPASKKKKKCVPIVGPRTWIGRGGGGKAERRNEREPLHTWGRDGGQGDKGQPRSLLPAPRAEPLTSDSSSIGDEDPGPRVDASTCVPPQLIHWEAGKRADIEMV